MDSREIVVRINIDEAVRSVEKLKQLEEERAVLPYAISSHGVELKPIDFLENFKEFKVNYDKDNPFYIYAFETTYKGVDFSTHAEEEDIKELSKTYNLDKLIRLESQFKSYKAKEVTIGGCNVN